MVSYIFISVAGIGIGVLSGLFGVGGGTIMVPLFRLVFGVDPLVATGTSLFAMVPTSLSGAIKHFRNHTALLFIGISAGVAGGMFSISGVYVASKSPSWLVMLACAYVIVYSATSMLHAASKKNSITNGIEEPRNRNTHDNEHKFAVDGSFKTVAKAAAIGSVAGFMGGYVGVGGGFLMVPLFMRIFHLPIKVASGTSLVAVCLIAIPAVVVQALLGNVAFLMGVFLLLGSIPGAWFGARVAQRAPELCLKKFFSIFLIGVGIMLFAHELL